MKNDINRILRIPDSFVSIGRIKMAEPTVVFTRLRIVFVEELEILEFLFFTDVFFTFTSKEELFGDDDAILFSSI